MRSRGSCSWAYFRYHQASPASSSVIVSPSATLTTRPSRTSAQTVRLATVRKNRSEERMTGVGSSKSLCHDVDISYSALTIFKGARQYSIDYTLHSRSGAPDACEVNGSMCIAGADTVWGSSAVQPVRETVWQAGDSNANRRFS